MFGQRPPTAVRQDTFELAGPTTPELRWPAVMQYVHETGAPDVGWEKPTAYPDTATATEHPETVSGETLLSETATAAAPLAAAGHCGAGIAVGAGSGVDDGTQPKPVQPEPAGHVCAVAPWPVRNAGLAVWKHLFVTKSAATSGPREPLTHEKPAGAVTGALVVPEASHV